MTIAPATASADVGLSDWPGYLSGPSHGSYNADVTSITPANSNELTEAWSWVVPKGAKGTSRTLWASPTVVDGVVYIGDENGYFYAIDEATDSVLWSDYFGVLEKTTCKGTSVGISSTAAVETDPETGTLTVYVNAPDGYLYALNAVTGATIWQSLVALPAAKKNTYYAWSSPAVGNGMVYVGIASQCTGPLVKNAGVLAFDQETGNQVARWYSVPSGQKGGSVWDSPVILPDGNVVVGTGNAFDDPEPEWAESVVELNGQTLELQSAWQLPSAKTKEADYDFGGSPTPFTADIDGQDTPMVGICDKNGVYYAFEQDNLGAGPVWQHRMGNPFLKGPGICISAAIWDGTQLIEGGGSETTIDGTKYYGSVQSLDPATGEAIWQTGLPGGVMGSPSEDGAGVIAAPTFTAPNNGNGVVLLDASDGERLTSFSTGTCADFSQPVFADNELILLDPKKGLDGYAAPQT